MKSILSNTIRLACTLLLAMVCSNKAEAKAPVSQKCVFAFYYNWYGNPEFNGKVFHWEHGVMKQSGDTSQPAYIQGKDNIASNFYPLLKTYSSTDPKLIAGHVEMMAKAKIDVIVVTWWGDNDFGSPALSLLFDEAARHNMKVCFHIEPYPGRNAETVRNNIAELIRKFGSHPAFYRLEGKPCFFLYDSYIIPASEWARVFRPEGDMTIRGTELDSKIIGLWVKDQEKEQTYFTESGMDGFYTYFAATGFTYGSTPAHWKTMQQWASQHGKIFIPCVGPGYIDTRVRPWNGSTTRDRANGKYYSDMFHAATKSGATYVGITSFNEWHEGTQIEPAIPFKSSAFSYLDYAPLAPDYYLTRTAGLVSEWK